MSGFADIAKLEFKYHRLSSEQKLEVLKRIKEKLESIDEVLFVYVHGGFLERDFFRDLDVALWLKDSTKAFYYTVDFSAKLEVEIRIPIDVQVLNEAPLPFKHHVFTKGKLLFSKDENTRLRLIEEVIRQYIDLKYAERLSSHHKL
jgi:predicted nucleotidyltransferase